eukprot:jgi/Hompol1/1512/HPOL_004755-RA
MKYSPHGRFLAIVLADRVIIASVSDTACSLVRELPIAGVLEVEFSPRETFISTFVRFTKLPNPDDTHRNVSIWNIETGEEALSFTNKLASKWNVDWTENESHAARLVSSEVQIYDAKNFSRGIASRLKINGISNFSMSPGKRPVIAVFYPEKNAQPGSVKLFDLTDLKRPLSEKSFFRADTVQFHWNSLGTNVLVFTHTDVDATGQSYYGETNLYYLSITGNFDCKVELDKKGPVHDVAWSPNAKEFVVVYGTMPSKATLFDHRASPMYEFGNAARNLVKFNHHGRLLFIGGFGNLAGDLDVWDRKTLKKVATIQASNSSSCDWSPDGRHIMTSTLYKRMKVDNGVKIWHHTGVLVHQVSVKELYESSWKPEPSDTWPERIALSPPPQGIAAAQAPKPTGVYRPPGARNGASTSSFYDRDAIDKGIASGSFNAVPGARTVVGANTKKNIKKPDTTKATAASNSNSNSASTSTPSQAASSIVAPPVAGGIVPGSALAVERDTDKRMRALTKKLKQIDELKVKQQRGEFLEETQLIKITTEEAVRRELEALQLSSASASQQ